MELQKKNWFATINFCNLNVDYLKNILLKIFEDWFTATNIHNDEAFTNIAKNFPHANKSCFTILFIILFVCYRDQLLDVCGGGSRDSVHCVCGSGPVPHEVTLLSHVLQRSLALSNSYVSFRRFVVIICSHCSFLSKVISDAYLQKIYLNNVLD